MEAEESRPDATPRPQRFCLTDGDIKLIKLVYEYRFARINNLVALSGRTYKKIHGRIFKLVENRYLKRIAPPLQKHIFAIGSAAVPVLVEQGTASAELANERLRSHELKELFLKHEMMVVDIHTMLSAAGTGAIQLVSWKEGWELHDHVDVLAGGHRKTLPVRPDAFFTLEDGDRPAGQNRVSFFLEADRSTTTHARFEDKITAYWNYLQQGIHTKKYGIRTFRVLTVAITPDRARNLCMLAHKALPADAYKFFLFGSLESFSLSTPSGILEPVFMTPRVSGRDRVSLIPKLQPQQPQPLASGQGSA